jgi:hypothetical protein
MIKLRFHRIFAIPYELLVEGIVDVLYQGIVVSSVAREAISVPCDVAEVACDLVCCWLYDLLSFFELYCNEYLRKPRHIMKTASVLSST